MPAGDAPISELADLKHPQHLCYEFTALRRMNLGRHR